MRNLIPSIILALGIIAGQAHAQPAVVSTIEPIDLVEYEQQPPAIQALIRDSLALTKKDLAYTFGSATPSKGGMDCSGTIHHLLTTQGVEKPPRMSHTIYLWLEEHSKMNKLEHVYKPTHPALRGIQPGDLVFWEGTYSVADRNPPISHVMLYLGTLKSDGQGVLFGASSGRRFRGKKIHGVSVFDFKVPTETSKAKLVGYGTIPGMRPVAPPAQTPVARTGPDAKPIVKLLKVFSNRPPK